MRLAPNRSALNASVLVLNRSYMAVRVITARRAFVMLYRQIAEVIHVEDGHYINYDFDTWCELGSLREELHLESQQDSFDDWIRCIDFSIQVPRIVRLVDFDRAPRQTLRFNRRNLFARDNNRCQYCGRGFPLSQLSFDHVIPRSRGGATSWENVVCSCVGCNSQKGGRTPQEARMKLIAKPVKPKHDPQLQIQLGDPRYQSWRPFISQAGNSVGGG